MKAVILAGGGGTRLWPVSRSLQPKQIAAVIGERTLLGATYDRVLKGFASRDIHVSTSIEHRAAVLAELPDLSADHVIAEPFRRDTAAAIGFALLNIAASDPETTFVIINSDAYVGDVREYHRVIREAERVVLARPEWTALVGITPSYPETGYGYIKIGERESGSVRNNPVYVVEKFVEKPDLATAKKYLAHGGYLWNPALIVGRVRDFLALFDRHLPEHAKRLKAIKAACGDAAVVRRQFAHMPSVSIDYGILENEEKLVVLAADFGWADVGNWRAVKDILSKDPHANVVRGMHIGIDSHNNLIYSSSGKLVATAGVSDMVIVETADALLVCPQKRAHDVKKIVAEMKGRRNLRKYL